MKQKLITILLAFGIAKAQAEKYLEKVDAPDEADFDVEKLLTDFSAKTAEVIKNDKEFVNKIQAAEAAKRNDIWLSKVKKATGITADEIKDKTPDEILQMAVDKIRKTGNATTEQLQQENLRLETELKDLKENVLPGKALEVDNFKKALLTENKLEKLISSKKLAVSQTVANAAIKAMIGNKYVLELDDNGELQIFTSGETKVRPKTADGKGLMTADDFISDILTKEKLIEVSGGGTGGTTQHQQQQTIITAGKNDKEELYKIYPHLRAAEEHAETVKADIAANSK